jgi:hypothetical protein
MDETATNGMAGILVPKANFINKVSRNPKKIHKNSGRVSTQR